ncbi:hypothetical protein V8E55_000244 [Tylopilus felleus]
MSRRLTPYLFAGLLGVVSGVYIFRPLFEVNATTGCALLDSRTSEKCHSDFIWFPERYAAQQERPNPRNHRNLTPLLKKTNRCYLQFPSARQWSKSSSAMLISYQASCLSCGVRRGCKDALSGRVATS